MTKPNRETKAGKWQKSLHDATPFLTFGISLVGAMLFYLGAGFLLDRWLDTSPTYLIVGSIVGGISFFIQFFRLTKLLSESSKKSSPQKKSPKEE
ncbi:MAG: AtpZ/AtpI family protein [Bacteroidetes bacterium]|nr:AtpZ/AtpI family protein [Bacteroidota bacterium]